MSKLIRSGKFWLGIAISIVFLWLAFRKTDPAEIVRAVRTVDPFLFILASLVPFISHVFRAWRWRYLLLPVKPVRILPLFSSLMIGYMANVFLPAHLGELVRAYSLSRKEKLPWPVVMASIVVDRIIDILSLLLLMAVAVFFFPFPTWVKQSGWIMLAVTLILFLLMIWMKRRRDSAGRLLDRFLRPFPVRFREGVQKQIHLFLDGLAPFAKKSHYLLVALQSIVIWIAYAALFYILFHAFGYSERFGLTFLAALVLQVVTTISVVVPSSPGYVGTYHFLCQLALGFFLVPADQALGFAIVAHAASFIPVLAVGIVFLFLEGISFSALNRTDAPE